MQQRTTSTLAFIGLAAAATLAAALMGGSARAEGPIGDIRPTGGTRSLAEVKAELLAHRAELSSYGGEWKQQQPTQLPVGSGYTRAQARAGYIAEREAVRAMNAEDSGSAYLAQMRTRATMNLIAGGAAR